MDRFLRLALASVWFTCCLACGGDDGGGDAQDGSRAPDAGGDGATGDGDGNGAGTGDGDGAQLDAGGDGDGDGDGSGDGDVGDVTEVDVDTLSFDAEAYRSDLEAIVGERVPGSEHWQAVQDLCADRLTALGFDVTRPAYETGVNVIGTMVGESAPEQLVVLGAHYDHIAGCPGADDNATGVAGALEAARLLADGRYARSLVIACWDEEEVGLLGSTAHAQALAESGMEVAVALSFEMIGYASDEPDSQMVPIGFDLAFPDQVQTVRDNDLRGDFIAFVGNTPAAGTLAQLSAAAEALPLPYVSLEATEALGPVLTNLLRSDHGSFWLQGAGGVMITDTANFRNPGYHCQNADDTLDTLDLGFAADVVVLTTAAVAAELDP